MANKYPIKTNEELKKQVSGIDINFDRDNLTSAYKRAASYIKQIISSDVWDLMIEHYNSENYSESNDEVSDETYKRLNKLVWHTQYPFVNMTFYYHFVWLQVRIGNDQLSMTDKDNTPFKYLSDEAKNELLEAAGEGINELVDYLMEEKNNISEWTDSSQYTSHTEFVFDNYHDFYEQITIEESAGFYIRARGIIKDIIRKDVKTRVKDITDINENILNDIKRGIAYRTLSRACIEMDYFFLPLSIRGELDNEHKKSQSVINTQTKMKHTRSGMSGYFESQAKSAFNAVDMWLAQQDKTPDDIPYKNHDQTASKDTTDKHISML